MSLNSFRTGLGQITSSPIGKWALFLVGALLVFSLAFSWNIGSGAGGGAAAPPQSATDVIATVNGDPITRQDFDQALDQFRRQIEQSGQPISISETPLMNNGVIDQLVDVKLQSQMAQKMGIKVSDEQIQKSRAQLVAQSGLAAKLSLPANASLSDIDAALAKAQSPTTLEERLPDDVVRQFILLGDPQRGIPGTLQSAINSQVTVNDQDVKDAFTQYHTRHILIGTKTRTDAQAKAQAEQVLAKAQTPGADFAALAKTYSDDPGTKSKGGDDGWISQTTGYVPEFKKAAFSLKPGEITSDVVDSPQFGYFIIKLDAVKTEIPKGMKQADLLAQVREQKQQAHYQELLTGFRSSANIVIKDTALSGDRALSQAARLGAGPQSQPLYQTALADYTKALNKNTPTLQKAQINAAMSVAYLGLNQKPQAIAACEAALKSTSDPELQMTLGNLYLQTKDKDNAIKHFQIASQLAWDNPSTHTQLESNFIQLGRVDLAAKESAWVKTYQQQHPPQGMPSGMMPGGMPPGAQPITVNSSGAPHSSGAVQIVPTPGAKPAH